MAVQTTPAGARGVLYSWRACLRETFTRAAAEFFTEYGEANRYTILEVIGKGSYGVVCSAIDNVTGEAELECERRARRSGRAAPRRA
jgi:hypothetical protein